MVSRSRPVAAIVLLITLLTMAGAAPLAAAQGNADNAGACQQGGWQWMVRDDGSTFANAGDCVSYGARGNAYGTPPHVEFHFTHYDAGRCRLDWTLVDGRPGDVVPVETSLFQTTYDSLSTSSATLTTTNPHVMSDDIVTSEYVYIGSTARIEGSGLLVAVVNTGPAGC